MIRGLFDSSGNSHFVKGRTNFSDLQLHHG